ncbi:MAG TPA: DUF1453 domain-containing protein [Pseudonocardiaceae bacterium]|jgi:membrane protein CcdC involved in cytochrome C biogenesis|nr:DUF1453 domain-containing protein [Pseudonocardiaceae bacterium]
MTDALILSGILLGMVLLTQIGRHRHNLFLGLMPFVTCTTIGVLIFQGGISATTANIVAGVVGMAIGLVVGIGLVATTRVERVGGRVYTKAGWPYLAIWLVVLLGRLAFIWAVEHVHWFTAQVGEFMFHAGISQDGVTLFFVLMALTMVVVRAGVILVRSRRLHQPSSKSLDTITA